MATYRHATEREPCPTCSGVGEVPPHGVNNDRPTLSEVLGDWIVCASCLGVGYFLVTPQCERVPA